MEMMQSRPSGVAQEIDLRELRDCETKTGGSILGQVMYAQYHLFTSQWLT